MFGDDLVTAAVMAVFLTAANEAKYHFDDEPSKVTWPPTVEWCLKVTIVTLFVFLFILGTLTALDRMTSWMW